MNCGCRWSEAVEKRLAHVETQIADVRRAGFPAAPAPVSDAPDRALAEILRAAYAGARAAEVRGYAISFPEWLLSDLAHAGFSIVRTGE